MLLWEICLIKKDYLTYSETDDDHWTAVERSL